MKRTSRSKSTKPRPAQPVASPALAHVHGGVVDDDSDAERLGRKDPQHNETLVRDVEDDR